MTKNRNIALTFTVLIVFIAGVFLCSGRVAYADDRPMVTSGSNVRFRAEPSLDGRIITSLPSGTLITETGRSGEWASVNYNGQSGYINTQFIKEAPKGGNSGTGDTSASAPAAVQPASTGGHIICIDPGHQGKGDSTKEPNGPGSSVMKARVAGGTHGTTSGLKEYQLTLAVGQLLKNELVSRGYTVYMTRESNDVNISNKERAQYAGSVGAEVSIRLHANGASNSATNGALALAPSSSNPYVGNLAAASQNLSSKVLSSYCAATGFANKGVQANDTMTGINWCTMSVTIIEMGFMTNPGDDANMANPAFQTKMVKGIADGIDAYFAK
ncbi:MAG: N-acetylmuramoyl-L-alanine amidase [Lachnospiraceae bacterium]|nr:N-acetylmuramoyl-L-alanine amidase [Lachnospiraceae bacterium]